MLNFVPENILDYCRAHSSAEDPIYQEITAYTYDHEEAPQMLSGPDVGALLQLLVRSLGATRILELGAFTGYSALKMAEAQPPDGELHTCEIDPQRAATINKFAEQVPWGKNLHVHVGPALDTLSALDGPFDFVFIDADKENYPAYAMAAKKLLRHNGLMVLDNALWSGRVIDPQDAETQAIDAANRAIQEDPDLINMLLPIRDGLMVAQKVAPSG